MEEYKVPAESIDRIYHATPLHLLPAILRDRELQCQRLLGYEKGRVTARRRDRQLAVDGYVHCSLKPGTPLLRHKLGLGYSHVVLEFDFTERESVEWALLPVNTKAWRSRWQCQPVTDPIDRSRLIRYAERGSRYQSVEVLISERISTNRLTSILAPSRFELNEVEKLRSIMGFETAVRLCPTLCPQRYVPRDEEILGQYYNRIVLLGTIGESPLLPFD